ncbi:hypothetical protein SLS56_005322 [Neofusicoccum ribis]|uniref:N-acetyltransferase domain-containing protein n=1 Tax=Neofusicoccum ribis TaxID=45134 RepID=A0ABR3SUQ7_9PEZI
MLLRPATDADIRAIASLSAVAFVDDPIETYLYPGRREYPEKFVDVQEALLRQSFDRPCGSAIIVTLEPGDDHWQGTPEIIGFCVYTQVETPPKIVKSPVRESDDMLTGIDSAHVMVDAANARAMSETCKGDDSHTWTEENFKRPKERYEFCDLAVHPKFQGRGIGKMMAGWVMDKARTEGVPVHTTSSPSGSHLYRSLGFRLVGKWKWCPVPHTEWDVMHWNPPDNQEGSSTQ